MTRWCTAALLLAALPAAAEPPDQAPADGRMDGDGIHVEILGKPVAVGERVDLPEGWFRVEEQGVEDREVGSFSIVALADTSGDDASGPDAATEPEPARLAPLEPVSTQREPARAAPERPCRGERAAYLRELWKTSGVEVEHPDALLEGLDSGEGAASGYYWFALQTDPIRPLAWSSDLRDRARDLARCVREERRR
jgi:hypothetical protein